jgi:hypothetical protein
VVLSSRQEDVDVQQRFGLQEIPPEEGLEAEWRALVAHQVHALTGMLSHLQAAVAERQQRLTRARRCGSVGTRDRMCASSRPRTPTGCG